MIDRRFVTLFCVSLSLVLVSGFFYIKFFYKHTLEEIQHSLTYEEIDLTMPVQEFLKRGANSAHLSIIKRTLVNQWIYFNQNDLMKLVMFAQGAKTFDELRKALQIAMQKEGSSNGAVAFVNSALQTIAKDKTLIEHVNKSLVEGLSQSMHELRGKIMQTEEDSREYKKLKTEYRKALYQWIDQKHGKLIDDLAAQF
jgi:hypothetical protein